MLMSVDYATPRIAKAILKQRRIAIIDWRWQLVVAFWHLIPRFIWRRFPAK
jgi:hypothetical protein